MRTGFDVAAAFLANHVAADAGDLGLLEEDLAAGGDVAALEALAVVGEAVLLLGVGLARLFERGELLVDGLALALGGGFGAEPEKLERLIAEEISEAVRELLTRIGTSAICDTCHRAIFWINTVNGGRRVPYSARGVPHTIDCDMAERPGKLGRWPTTNPQPTSKEN